MEAALRSAYEIITGRELPFNGLHVNQLGGLQGVKELSFTVTGTLPEWSFLEGVTMELAVAHGLGNARQVMESIKSGKKSYHFVEIMTLSGRLHRRRRTAEAHHEQGAAGAHQRDLQGRRGEEAAQIA